MLPFVWWQLAKRVGGVVFTLVANPAVAKQKRNGRKFADQSWQLFIHLAMTGYELLLMHPEGPEQGWRYWHNTTLCYEGPGGAFGVPAGVWLERLYVVQSAIWVYTAISHRWLESRHKDYYVMYTHHVVTIGLA